MIILNENEWARQQIEKCNLGKKPAETLRLVARFYIDSGYSLTETRRKLDEFLWQCDPLISLPKWSDTLDRVITKAKKRAAVCIDSIPITETEMQKIDALDGKQLRRLAFTLLCLAKYWKAVNPEGDYWVNNKDSEIMNMANISTSLKRQSLLYSQLKECEMIKFSKKIDNTNVKVCFVDDINPILHITDFRNLGFQYLMYHDEPYFECSNCGIITKLANPKNKGRQKYCKECATKIRLQQSINSVMRIRRQNEFKNVGN